MPRFVVTVRTLHFAKYIIDMSGHLPVRASRWWGILIHVEQLAWVTSQGPRTVFQRSDHKSLQQTTRKLTSFALADYIGYVHWQEALAYVIVTFALASDGLWLDCFTRPMSSSFILSDAKVTDSEIKPTESKSSPTVKRYPALTVAASITFQPTALRLHVPFDPINHPSLLGDYPGLQETLGEVRVNHLNHLALQPNKVSAGTSLQPVPVIISDAPLTTYVEARPAKGWRHKLPTYDRLNLSAVNWISWQSIC